jgi:hypothetical protein
MSLLMYWKSDFQYCAAISGDFLYLPEYDGHVFKKGRWYLIDVVPPSLLIIDSYHLAYM